MSKRGAMKRVIGFALFWLAFGMLLMMILQNIFVGILLIIICLLTSYTLFCCR